MTARIRLSFRDKTSTCWTPTTARLNRCLWTKSCVQSSTKKGLEPLAARHAYLFRAGVGAAVMHSKLKQISQTNLFETCGLHLETNAAGFVFFRLPNNRMQLGGYKVYIPEIRNLKTRQSLLFFEIDLK